MILNKYKCPPFEYLLQVAEHCPKAVATYMRLWNVQDKNCRIAVNKETIREDYLINLAKFRHDLMLLLKEALINVDENEKMIRIELIGWQDDDEDQS